MFYKLLNAYTRQFAFPHRGLKYFLKVARWLNLENKTYDKKLADDFYMQVNPSEHIQQQLFWYGYYEKELGDLIKKILRPGDVFVDIGANIGYFSLLAAKHQPDAKVISFEPVSSVFNSLKENILLNKIRNITTVNAAVSERSEEKEIYLSAEDNIGMSSFIKPGNYSGKSERVTVVTLDEWYSSFNLTKIDIIKLDVEGSELSALKGMGNVIQTFKPIIIAEINPETLLPFDLTPDDIIKYLGEFEYRSFLIFKNGELRRIKDYKIIETNNVLFIHEEKLNFLSLFNLSQ